MPPLRPASSERIETGHLLGSHLSIAGGMHHAIEAALRLGFETVQVFVKNQRQWRAAPIKDDDFAAWQRLRQTPGFGPIVAHATYLVNLAATDDALRTQSRDAFCEELLRCELLGIPYLVVHPGAAGQTPVADACRRVADSLDSIFEQYPRLTAMPLLETTAGQGTTLGRSFEELAAILMALREPARVGVCIDTCHVFAAGYDICDPAKYAAMIDLARRTVGLERIRCWHLNDSRGDLGSHLDRHEHIGKGKIGVAGFRNVLRDDRFHGVPMILETPKETAPDGCEWDTINAALLRKLAGGSRVRNG
ncbi:MAG: deoxyribonuclease IV [Phycisphaerae bacterium]